MPKNSSPQNSPDPKKPDPARPEPQSGDDAVSRIEGIGEGAQIYSTDELQEITDILGRLADSYREEELAAERALEKPYGEHDADLYDEDLDDERPIRGSGYHPYYYDEEDLDADDEDIYDDEDLDEDDDFDDYDDFDEIDDKDPWQLDEEDDEDYYDDDDDDQYDEDED